MFATQASTNLKGWQNTLLARKPENKNTKPESVLTPGPLGDYTPLHRCVTMVLPIVYKGGSWKELTVHQEGTGQINDGRAKHIALERAEVNLQPLTQKAVHHISLS